MRGRPTFNGDDTENAVQVHLHDIGRREIFSGQHTGALAAIPWLSPGQTFPQTQTNGPDILGTVTQVGIIHAAEKLTQLFHRMSECPGSADALVLYPGQSGIEQLGITCQLHLGGDDVTIFCQLFRYIGHALGQGRPYLCGSSAQSFLLLKSVIGRNMPLFVLAHVMHEADGADSDAR